MRQYFKAGLFAACAVMCGIISFVNRESFSHYPWEHRRAFSFPTGAVSVANGGLIVADLGGKRLSRVDGDGRLMWHADGCRRTGGFYSATLLHGDGSNGAWVLNSVQSEQTASVVRLEIRRIGADGRIREPIWVRETAESELGVWNRTPYFCMADGSSMRYLVTDAEGSTSAHEVSFATGQDRIVRTFPGLDAYQYVVAAYDGLRGKGWFLDNGGRIIEWGFDGAAPETVYDNIPDGGSCVTFPSDLRVFPGSADFWMLDGKGEVFRIDRDGRRFRMLDGKSARRPLYISGFAATDSGGFLIANEARHEIVSWDPQRPEELRSVDSAATTGLLSVFGWSVWFFAAAGIFFLLLFFQACYREILERRMPLLLKQLGIFLPLVICAVLAVSLWIFNDMMNRYRAEVADKQTVWGVLGSSLVSADDISMLGFGSRTQKEIMASDAYARLTASLSRIVHENSDSWNSSVFDYLYIPSGDSWYVFDQFTYFERYLPKPDMLEAYRTGESRIVVYDDAYSTWQSCFTPVRSSDGRIVALFEIAIDRNVFDEVDASIFLKLALALGITIFILVEVLALTTFWLLRSIRTLKNGAILLSEGNYDTQVTIRSRDEIEDLGEVFNKMSREIRSYVARVIELNKANAKFVPSQFLMFLGKESITDIRLGDQVQREMTVLFSDIRAFTSLSKRMTPEENFNFINRYLMETGPVIRTNGGFIDKYIGDAIMALFPSEPVDGLRAAIGMYSGLDRFNGENHDIQIGIGLHTGSLMLGIIGEAERFDGTVISDAVNLASRLESLTKYYGACILVSGQTLDRIADKSFFISRIIDFVLVKGRSEPVEIHEILIAGHCGGDGKIASRTRFESALRSYFKGDFESATAEFESLLREFPGDRAIPIYLQRMSARTGDRTGWTGITVLDSK